MQRRCYREAFQHHHRTLRPEHYRRFFRNPVIRDLIPVAPDMNQLLQQELTSALSGVRQWHFRRWAEALKGMQERPRRRTLQTVPERSRPIIAACQAQGVSNI